MQCALHLHEVLEVQVGLMSRRALLLGNSQQSFQFILDAKDKVFQNLIYVFNRSKVLSSYIKGYPHGPK